MLPLPIPRGVWHNCGNMDRTRRKPRPLDSTRLEEMAVAYLARFATTRARLESYLRRKLRERGWAGDGEPPVAALVERLCAAGYVDDTAYAIARGASLLRRGYGVRRVDQALGAAGVAEDILEDLRPPVAEQRRAALALARRRRFGPFGAGERDPATRERQLAAMVRAGHPLDNARQLLDAATVEAAEEWAGAADGD